MPVLSNVSFGIFAFHPLGWGLMLAVIAMEAVALRTFLRGESQKRNHFLVSLVANAASGAAGFVISMGITGGWWLVIWVPWVTANEASHDQWPELAAFMGVAYVLSVLIESAVVKAMLPQAPATRLLAVQILSNLFSSIFLLSVFWAMEGVPGS
jgi:hypothetical protein